MPKRSARRHRLQFDLFRPRPQRPRWNRLPDEVRRKALPLIASLLQTALQAMKEGGHER
jgi:hypothetical protein